MLRFRLTDSSSCFIVVALRCSRHRTKNYEGKHCLTGDIQTKLQAGVCFYHNFIFYCASLQELARTTWQHNQEAAKHKASIPTTMTQDNWEELLVKNEHFTVNRLDPSQHSLVVLFLNYRLGWLHSEFLRQYFSCIFITDC